MTHPTDHTTTHHDEGQDTMHTTDTAPTPTTYVIQERVLTDDELTVAPIGYRIPGGYVASLSFHDYANPWSDSETVRRFRTAAAARRFIVKRYGDDVDWDTVDDALAAHEMAESPHPDHGPDSAYPRPTNRDGGDRP